MVKCLLQDNWSQDGVMVWMRKPPHSYAEILLLMDDSTVLGDRPLGLVSYKRNFREIFNAFCQVRKLWEGIGYEPIKGTSPEGNHDSESVSGSVVSDSLQPHGL